MTNEELDKHYQKFSPEEALKKLITHDKSAGDAEDQHWAGDQTLVGLLLHLGHYDIVREWDKLHKWYS